MKKVIVLALLFVVATFTFNVLADSNIYYTEGTWSKDDFRSGRPVGQMVALQTMPSVSMENGIMFMSFNTDLSNLKVSVYSTKGILIYETLVSGSSGLTLPVRLGLQNGSYMITLSHPQLGSMADKVSVN